MKSSNGHRSPATIARITKIPIRTVKYNIVKIKNQGTIEDRPRKVTANDDIALDQWIRRNNETKSQELVQKLLHDRDLNVSRWTVQCQLKRMGYKSALPYRTSMLTQKHKEARVQWAIQHKDDDWSRTIFTDETSYQLFRNTIRRWSKNPRDRLIVQKYFQRGLTGGQVFRHVEQLGITRNGVYRIISRLCDTGSIQGRPRTGRPRTCRSKKRIKRIREKIRRNPERSARKLAMNEDIDNRSMRGILKIDLDLKPYKN
ncbi:unnamed protein product, partial [Rotaria magnacalcarata]